MALFLAINTSSVTLLPTGVIALRAAAGSADPAAIFPTTLFATACSTVVGVVSAKLLARVWRDRSIPAAVTSPAPQAEAADDSLADALDRGVPRVGERPGPRRRCWRSSP